MRQYRFIVRAIMAAAVLSPGGAMAGPPPPAVASGKGSVEPPKETDWCDDIFGLTTLYKNKDNPYIQEFAFTGRYHGQYWFLDSDQGNDDDWEHRRFRLGFKAVVFQDFEVVAEMFSELDDHDFYAGLTDAYIAWKQSDAFHLTVGRQKPKFSLDWSTSSREILTIERNILINNFGIERETGLSIAGKHGKWSYFTSITNNDVRDSADDEVEFGDLDGGWSYVASIGYDVKEYLGTDKAVLRFDYLHSNHESEDEQLTKFDNGVAASLNVRQGKWGIITEALYGEGDSGEMWGVYVMPTYDITKKLQAVARYTHARSSDDILRAQSRYEREASLTDGGNGEEYNAGYLGLTYYICSHKLKLMTGLEYSDMDGGSDGGDFSGWTWTSGVRVYW
jgi:phosphate-selective porin OprO/OprP